MSLPDAPSVDSYRFTPAGLDAFKELSAEPDSLGMQAKDYIDKDDPENSDLLISNQAQPYIAKQYPSASETHEFEMRRSTTRRSQNKRSSAKKPREDDMDPSLPDSSSESRIYSPFPTLSQGLHPSLRSHRRSQSISSSPVDDTGLRRSAPRRSATPYGSSVHPRTKRSRPEPFQLDALKQLYEQTTTPSIEERTALAQKIGMDVAKVTNWFRNSRQTDRKRQKKAGSEDDDYEVSRVSRRARSSRPQSPSFHSSSSSHHSDYEEVVAANASHSTDDEYQEAVTPSPESSPPPESKPIATESVSLALVNAALYPSSLIADAQLLLDFHRHAVR